jgi:nicotinate-nucleotide adenylyltransferase
MVSVGQHPCVGIFGGSFDPPHLAHRSLLEAAITQLGLEALHVIPTGQAWHKPRPLSPAKHRLAMCQLAFGDLTQVHVDDRETRRTGPSYTIDTLREIQAQQPSAKLFLIIGADQAVAFDTWKSWSEIYSIAIISVAERENVEGFVGRYDIKTTNPDRFRRLSMPAINISATDIRNRISAGQAVNALVCEHVARYIAENHLYQTN